MRARYKKIARTLESKLRVNVKLVQRRNLRSTDDDKLLFDSTITNVPCHLGDRYSDGSFLFASFKISQSSIQGYITSSDYIIYEGIEYAVDRVSLLDGYWNIEALFNSVVRVNVFDSDSITWDSSNVTF